MRPGLDPARYSPKAPAGVIGTEVSEEKFGVLGEVQGLQCV